MRGVDLLISENSLRSYSMSRAQRVLIGVIGPGFLRADALSELNFLTPNEWNELAYLAIERHRVGSIFWSNLKNLRVEALEIPAEFKEQLDQASLKVLHDALYAKAESERIVGALNDVDIEPICLKGWPLEEQLTGTIGRRTSRDVDLMVNKDQMMMAIGTLLELGYASEEIVYPISQRRLTFWLNSFKHVELTHRRSGFVVDLHARPFANPRLLSRSNLTLQRARFSKSALTTRRVAIPDPVSNLFYLSVHGFLHRWDRLKWLVDMPPLVESLSAKDWHLILEQASRMRLVRPLGTGLALANVFLGMRIPDPAKPLVQGVAVRMFCSICIREILADRDPSRAWRSLSSIAGQLTAEHGVSTDLRTFLAGFKPKLISKQALRSSNGLPDDRLFTLYLTRPLSLPNGLWRMFRRE